MAMTEVTGGSKKVAPMMVSSTGYASAFSIAAYREQQAEEKRKREEAARLAAEKKHLAEVQGQVALKKLTAIPTSDLSSPTAAFQARAQEVKGKLGVSLGAKVPVLNGVTEDLHSDPIMQYNKLVRSWGKDKVAGRMAAITDRWNAVNGAYNGTDLIWEMTRSPYTVDEIDQMFSEAHYILTDPQNKHLGTRASSIEEKRVLLRDKYNIKSREWQAMERIFQSQEDAEIPTGWEEDPVMTALVMTSFIPNPFSFAGTAGKVAAAGAEKLAGTLLREASYASRLAEAASTVDKASALLNAERATEAAIRANAAVSKVKMAAETLRASQLATSYSSTVALQAALNSAKWYKRIISMGKAFGPMAVGFQAGLETLANSLENTILEKSVKAEQGLQFAASPLTVAYDSPFQGQIAENQPTPLQDLRDMRQFMLSYNNKIATGDAEAGQQILAITQMWQDVGVGLELEPSTIFTPQWQADVLDAMSWTTRAVYDQQRQAIADGDAPYWAPVNGDPLWARETAEADRIRELNAPYMPAAGEDATTIEGDTTKEGWAQWFENREMRLRLAEEARENDPEGAAFWESFGFPRNKYEGKAFWNSILSNGWAQAIYATPLKMAELAGRGAEATLAAGNLWVREQIDPVYQASRKALFDYIAEQDFQPNEWYDKLPERGQMNEAYCKTQIAVGYLKDDPEAKRLWGRMQQSAQRLINERYAADPFLTAAYGLSPGDYESIRQTALDHPEAVEATNMAFWIASAAANPIGRARRLVFKHTVKPTMPDWNSSGRAYAQVQKVVDLLMDKDMGAAARVMQGSGAASVLNKFYNWRPGKKGYHLDWRSEAVQQLARESVNEVAGGTPHRVAQILEGAPDPVVNNVVAKAAQPLSHAQIAGWVGQQNLPTVSIAQYTRAVEDVAKYIAKRQSSTGDAISRNTLLSLSDQYLGEVYVTGRGGSIFPYLRDSSLSAPKRSVAWVQESIQGLRNDFVREFLSRTVLPFVTRGPTATVDFHALGTTDRMYDAALAVSQDAAWAARFRSRWVSVKNDQGYRRLIDDLDLKFSQRYRSSQKEGIEWYERVYRPKSEAAGQVLAPDPWGHQPGTKAYETADVVWHDATGAEHRFNTGADPELLTRYLSTDATGNPVYRQALPDKVYAMYAARVHRAALWAPYNTKHAWNTLQGMTEANRWRNAAFRYPPALFHYVSTPLRQWTVAMGAPLLFQKHAITDTFRTAVEEGPFSILEAFGLRPLSVKGHAMVPEVRSIWQRNLAKIFDDVSADTRNYVEYRKSVSHASEAQWQSGNREYKYQARTIWGKDGRLVDLDGSTDALLRITRGPIFTEWAKGESVARYVVRDVPVPAGTRYEVVSTANQATALLREIDGWSSQGSHAGRANPRLQAKEAIESYIARGNESSALAREATGHRMVLGAVRDADGELIGVGMYEAGSVLHPGSVHVGNIAVRPDAQGGGIAEYLTYKAASEAITRSEGLSYTRWRREGDSEPRTISYQALLSKYGVRETSGEAAVRAYLNTPAGKQFLGTSDWGKLYHSVGKEMEITGRVLKPKDRAASMAEEFIDTIVRKEWDRLETALPDIMPTLKARAANAQQVSKYEVQELIKNNPTNNAVLSTPYESIGDQTLAGSIVGKAMMMNKWNRDVMFDAVFTRTYRRLTKDGMDPNEAAYAASDVAEMNVSRVHFDLANATAVEARHRWLAWFATKHRLFGTYMAKLALERPQLAAAIPTIERWMEERNEDKDVSEFDKYDLVFDIGGAHFSVNLAPYMWFSEYPLESSLALLMERGLEYLGENVAGLNLPGYLKPTATPFGMNFTRGDSFFYTLNDVIKGRDIKNDQELQAYLDSLPQDHRMQWRRLIMMQKAVATQKGQPISDVEALGRAQGAALWSEGWQMFKLFSGKVYGVPAALGGKPMEELEIDRLLRAFTNETDDDKAKQMLRDHPALAIRLNASMDPVEQTQMNEGWRKFDLAYAKYEADMQQAADDGAMVLANRYDGITKQFYDAIDTIRSENDTFNEYWGATNDQGFLDALGLLLPLMPRDKVAAMGMPKDDKEIEAKKAELKLDLVNVLDTIGLAAREGDGDLRVMEGAQNLMVYQLLEDAYVNTPLAEFTRENPYSLAPYRAENTARYLARKTDDGVFRKERFLDLIKEQTFRQWVGAGIGSGGNASSAKPMMGYMDYMKRDTLGWNTMPGVQEVWLSYAVRDAEVHQWAWTSPNPTDSEKTISPSSTVYKETYKATMEAWLKEARTKFPPEVMEAWESEYQFSQLRLHDRLLYFDDGSNKTEEAETTRKFLGIVSDMWSDLDSYDNGKGITPASQSGGPIMLGYLKQVGDLAKANPDWWEMFQNTYPLSKFGFSTNFKLTDSKYQFLYARPDDNIADEEETIWLQRLGE